MRRLREGFAVALLSVPMFAQPSADTSRTVYHPDVIVTASKSPRTPGNVTQQIDLLRGADLKNLVSGNRNLAEVIQYQPGASVSVLSRNDANWGTYGGIGPKYGTYMIEGLPIDAFVDPMGLTSAIADQIEIQRGPASVLYPNYLSQDFAGNQSPLSGTVNLLLKSRIDHPETRIGLSTGSYATYAADVAHQNASGPWAYFIGGSYEQSDYTNYGSPNSWLNMLDNPEYKKTRLYAGGAGTFDKQRISLFMHETIHSGDAGRPNRGYDHAYTLVNGSYAYFLNELISINAKGGIRLYNRTWQEDNYSPSTGNLTLNSDNGVKQTIIPLDLSISVKHHDRFSLTAGSDAQIASYKTESTPNGGTTSTGNDASSRQIGVYVQEELSVDQLLLRGGLRCSFTQHDITTLNSGVPGNPDQSWSVLLWSAGASYHMNEHITLFANIGTSFVSPGLKSIGGTLPFIAKGDTTKTGQIPNPDLDPESGLGYDAGVRGSYESATYSIRVFGNRISDAIIDNVVMTSSTGSQSQSINAGKTMSTGVEISIAQRLSDQLQWFTNGTVLSTTIENPLDPDQDGADVPFVPDKTMNAGVTYSSSQYASISLYVHHSGRIYDGSSKSGRSEFQPHTVLNATITGTLSVVGTPLGITLQLYNLLDEAFQMPWQFQDPGFSWNVGVSATF